MATLPEAGWRSWPSPTFTYMGYCRKGTLFDSETAAIPPAGPKSRFGLTVSADARVVGGLDIFPRGLPDTGKDP